MATVKKRYNKYGIYLKFVKGIIIIGAFIAGRSKYICFNN